MSKKYTKEEIENIILNTDWIAIKPDSNTVLYTDYAGLEMLDKKIKEVYGKQK